MAKENHVLLVGELQSSPIVNEQEEVAKYVIKTFRRNNKVDYPIINVYGMDLINKIKDSKEGDYIMVKGFISTSEVKKAVICPHCQTITEERGTTTEITVIENINIGTEYSLAGVQEVSNTIMILGSLCRDPEFRILPNTTTPSTQYQLAINRKFNVQRKGSSQTDYPWVNSFGRQAEQDAVRLETGSQVFIQGGIQTRSVQKNITCNQCKEEFKAEDFVAEIVPYSVEYLNNCKFTD